MEPSQYARAYRRDAREQARYPAEVEGLLQPAREWSHRWGVILHDLMTGAATPEPDEFTAFSLDYCDWFNHGLGGLEQALTGMLEELVTEDLFGQVLMELNFHRLNARVQYAWGCMIRSDFYDPHAERVLTERARYELANDALLLYRGREAWIDADVFFDPDAALVRAWHTGALTEFDAAIALMDLSRNDPAILVVPAPAQFEHLAGPANADFIVVDRRAGQVRGIQVKANLTGQQHTRYDPARITLIDGARDLHNTLAVRTRPRSSEKQIIPWPGLIAAHYLRELVPTRETDWWVTRTTLVQKKIAARHYSGTIPSRTQTAYDTVAERVRRDLAA